MNQRFFHKWPRLAVDLLLLSALYSLFHIALIFSCTLEKITGQLEYVVLTYTAKYLSSYKLLHIALNGGVMSGIKTMASFIPIIATLYFSISILKQSGYLSRLLSPLKKLVARLGFQENALMAIVMAFGCNTQAIIATSSIADKNQRKLVILLIPFLTCRGRLIISVLFCASFLNSAAGLILLFYCMGIVMAIFTVLLLKIKKREPHIDNEERQITHYQIPKAQLTVVALSQSLLQAWNFIKGTGSIIVIASTILCTLSSVNFEAQVVPQNKSVLAALSKKMSIFFGPMGISEENWPAVASLFSGLIAKEAMAGTIVSLYSLHTTAAVMIEDIPQNSTTIIHTIPLNVKDAILERFGSHRAIVAYLIFIMLSFPCLPVYSVMAQCIGKKEALFSICWTTVIAYLTACTFHLICLYTQIDTLCAAMYLNIIATLLLMMVIPCSIMSLIKCVYCTQAKLKIEKTNATKFTNAEESKKEENTQMMHLTSKCASCPFSCLNKEKLETYRNNRPHHYAKQQE